MEGSRNNAPEPIESHSLGVIRSRLAAGNFTVWWHSTGEEVFSLSAWRTEAEAKRSLRRYVEALATGDEAFVITILRERMRTGYCEPDKFTSRELAVIADAVDGGEGPA